MSQYPNHVHNEVTGTVGGTVIQCGDLNAGGTVFGKPGRVVPAAEAPDCDTITIVNGRVFVDSQDLTA